MSRETRVWVRPRGDAWEVKGASTPRPDGVTEGWGAMPPWEPWPTILATALAVPGFEARAQARGDAGVLWVLKPIEGRVLH